METTASSHAYGSIKLSIPPPPLLLRASERPSHIVQTDSVSLFAQLTWTLMLASKKTLELDRIILRTGSL